MMATKKAKSKKTSSKVKAKKKVAKKKVVQKKNKVTNKVFMIMWVIKLKGKNLSFARKKCIESISIEENCDGSDTMTIVVNDPKYEYISDNLYLEDVKVSATIHWSGCSYKSKFNGYISAIDISFPDTGVPQLTIECVDNSHIMNRKKRSRTWKKKTSAQVVRIIAKQYGYKAVIQKGFKFRKKATIEQSDQTDIELLESLASDERYPFLCKVSDKKIYYQKRGLLKKAKCKLGYRKYPFNVVSFDPQINKETKQVEVSSSSVSSKNKKVNKSTSNDKNTKTDSQGKKSKTSESKTGKSVNFDYSSKSWK